MVTKYNMVVGDELLIDIMAGNRDVQLVRS